jgi:flagellar biosynthesis/type III secretory pathway protein FliH
VIPATLRPPSHSLELAIASHQEIRKLSRRERAELLHHTRRRSKKYSGKARERGYQAGVERGRNEGIQECRALIVDLQKLYAITLERARGDVLTMAHHIVETLIGEHIKTTPEILKSWIQKAVEHLRINGILTLRYHPRYEDTLQLIIETLPHTIHPVQDPLLREADFAIETNAGAITFSWRELLASLRTEGIQDGDVR